MAEGKEVKFFCVGRKGDEQLRRQLCERRSSNMVDLRAVAQLALRQAEDIAEKIIARFEGGEFDVCTLFYSRFKSVITQIPTAQQIIPPVVDDAAERRAARLYEYEPDEETSSHDCCRAISRCRSSARCWRTTPPSTPRR